MQKVISILGIIGILIIIFFHVSCDSSTEPTNEYSISIMTEDSSYLRTSAKTVIINLKNNSTNKVYLPIDSTFVLERKEGDNWITGIWSIHRISSYDFYSLFPNIPHSEEMSPGFLPSSGTYRFKFFIYKDSILTKLLPEHFLYSNSFEATE